jgi:outer membrane protein insertion porin family
MKFWAGLVRGLGVACAVYGAAIVGVGAGAVAVSGPAQAQSASSIVVQGNRRVDAETIRSYFGTNPGERLDAVKLNEAYQALLATGLFEDVRINQAGGRIVVTVVEASIINRVQFEGNRQVKDEQLAAEVQSKSRAPLSRQTVRSDVQRIVDIYRGNGRYNVRVDPKIIDRQNGRVDLVFEITEGKKTTVKDISFVGNRAYSSSRLADVIKTSKTNIFSFFKSTDNFDADKVEADKDLLRRFYLKHGYADVRIVSAVSEFDPARNGFVVTFVIDEGAPYRFSTIDIQSNVRDVNPNMLRSKLRMSSGELYDAEAVEKTVEQMTLELAKSGYAFAQVRPRGDRNYENHTVSLVFVVDQGARAYIERINIRGNTRTRDYVIRREFDIGEGDPYNHALIDRAEKRLKNLGYFKTVKLTSEPGSAPDRVIVNVDVEETATGEFSVAGGYSTSDGLLAEVSIGERNLLGRGQYAKASVQYSELARGFELSFVEPYLLGYRLAFGIDVFSRVSLASTYQSYQSESTGFGFRFGIPITDEVSFQARYSLYNTEIKINPLNNCFPYSIDPLGQATCIPASPAIRELANSGGVLTSLVGYTLTYNTLDNNRNPTKGMLAELKQDFAGVGGDSQFIRTTGDVKYYYNVWDDLVALFHVQGGNVTGWGNRALRSTDHFFLGPSIVRGFEPSGIGPRDTTPGSFHDALGGTLYWGASFEVQYPLFFAPKDNGLKLAAYVDAGSVWDYQGITTYQGPNDLIAQTITPRDTNIIRSSVGVGLIWDSPFGPLRFDYAVALTKDDFKVFNPVTGLNEKSGDRTQAFRFSGGTKF